MARKVFISFLGITNYKPTLYEIGGNMCKQPVRYIQEAIIELLFQGWTPKDRIIIFGTKGKGGSYVKNWLANGHRTESKRIIKGEGLAAKLRRFNIPNKFVAIPEGFSSNEVWEMMEIIKHQLKPNDEIYLDVTYAFRSIPMLATSLFNYTKFLNKTTLAAVYYGAFEKLKSLEHIPEEERAAPIVDMTDIVRLQDWTFAAADYIENGNASKLKELAELDTKSSDVKELVSNLSLFCDQLLTCRGLEIAKSVVISKLINQLKALSATDVTPLNPIINEIRKHLSTFEVSDEKTFSIRNGFAAARWCYDHHMYQQAATILEENIVSYFCLKSEYDFKKKRIQTEAYRKRIKNAFWVISGGRNIKELEIRVAGTTTLDEIKNELEKTSQKLESIFEKVPLMNSLPKKFWDNYNNLSSLIRNDLNHNGMRSKPSTADNLKNDINNLIDYFSKVLQ